MGRAAYTIARPNYTLSSRHRTAAANANAQDPYRAFGKKD